MSNYIFADLKRIIKRIPFLISMLLINLALAGVLLFAHGTVSYTHLTLPTRIKV